jgi:hypothetical protein
VSKTPYKVFISATGRDLSRERKRVKELLAKQFAGRDVEIFDASNLATSVNIRRAIRKAIEDAAQFVIIWNGRAAESAFVNYEIGMAEALGKPIVVVVPKGDRSSIPDYLAENTVLELEDAR